jgi:hypothetical protein
MQEKCREVARELLRAGKTEHQETFTIDGTSDEIVVWIVRKSKLVKLSEGFGLGVSQYGSGNVCTTCNGTGRI